MIEKHPMRKVTAVCCGLLLSLASVLPDDFKTSDGKEYKNAIVRVTDSDCGPATESGPATCTGGNTNTVADIICGTNATCALDVGATKLTITMTTTPNPIAAGSTPGAQFPVVVTDTSGITDLSGNVWDIRCDGQSSSGPACANGTTPKRVIP